MRAGTLVIAASLVAASSSFAQLLPQVPDRDVGSTSQPYNVRELNFDLWCQQLQRYSQDRCHARNAADVKAFEDYRDTVERYDLDYQKQNQRDRNFQNRINRDPTQTARDRQDATP